VAPLNITDAFISRDSSNSVDARHIPYYKEANGSEVSRHRLGAQQQRGTLNSKIASTGMTATEHKSANVIVGMLATGVADPGSGMNNPDHIF
jgi:hypothetical protein